MEDVAELIGEPKLGDSTTLRVPATRLKENIRSAIKILQDISTNS
jgi:hypothetical protein